MEMCPTPKVTLMDWTRYPLELVWSLWEASKTEDPLLTPEEVRDRVDPEEVEKLFRAVIAQRIPIGEHVHFTFMLENVSVSWREQAVRHRIGTKPGPERLSVDIGMEINGLMQSGVIPNLAESSWWSQCFTGDTRIRLLDGTAPTLAELATKGGEFWVYSCTKDGCVVPGMGHSARKTGHKELVEVELDNGEKVRCTGDHLWLGRDGEYVEAKDLKPGTSLMPLYLKRDRYGYEMHKVPATGRYSYTHSVVDERINGPIGTGMVVHHASFDKLNNSPDALVRMDGDDHMNLHAGLVTERMRSDPDGHRAALSAAQRRRWAGLSEEQRDKERAQLAQARGKISSEKRSAAAQKLMTERWETPEWREKMIPVLAANARNQGDNHTVVAVRFLQESADVYDITVDEYHNFALAAGVFVHNSMRIQDMSKFADKGAYRLPETVLQHPDPDVAKRFHDGMKTAQDTYKWLVHEKGIPMEDARELIGLGAQHRISWDLNIGSLQHIVGKRGCWILQLGIWGSVIMGMVKELTQKVHPIFAELVTPPCIRGDEFTGCVYHEECRRRYTGDDSLPPCPLHLNYHHVDEQYRETLPLTLPHIDVPMKEAMVKRAEDYRVFWGRDPWTGVKSK